MDLETKYVGEAPAPKEPSLHEALVYIYNEIERRSFHSTDGLTNDDLNHEPGHGAWSIGEILKHELGLVRFITETLEPGSTKDLSKPEIGEKGNWFLDAIIQHREQVGERFREVFARATPEQLMEKRPDVPPEDWADWPVLMRILRPLTDLATHTGQVN